MTIDDCLSIASDCYIGLSADEDKVTCLFVYGRGIELKDDEEIKIANEIVSALSGFIGHIKPDVNAKGQATPSTQEPPKETKPLAKN